MKKKIVNRLLWILIGIFLTLAGQEIYSGFKTKKKTKKMISLSISSVDREIGKLYLLNINTALFDYDAKDTLFIHKEPMKIRLKESYDMLLQDPDIIAQMDTDFHSNIEKFKDVQTMLSNWYNRLPNDFSRDVVKDKIENQLLYEKEILTAELDYLENEIDRDSLIDVRENSFRKYLSHTLILDDLSITFK